MSNKRILHLECVVHEVIYTFFTLPLYLLSNLKFCYSYHLEKKKNNKEFSIPHHRVSNYKKPLSLNTAKLDSELENKCKSFKKTPITIYCYCIYVYLKLYLMILPKSTKIWNVLFLIGFSVKL